MHVFLTICIVGTMELFRTIVFISWTFMIVLTWNEMHENSTFYTVFKSLLGLDKFTRYLLWKSSFVLMVVNKNISLEWWRCCCHKFKVEMTLGQSQSWCQNNYSNGHFSRAQELTLKDADKIHFIITWEVSCQWSEESEMPISLSKDLCSAR